MIFKWFGTLMFLTAATLLSLNIGVSPYGFILFLLGHVVLTYYFLFKNKDLPMFTQNFFFIGIDTLGIVRWF